VGVEYVTNYSQIKEILVYNSCEGRKLMIHAFHNIRHVLAAISHILPATASNISLYRVPPQSKISLPALKSLSTKTSEAGIAK
jgi:hypothetical protein